MYRIDFNHLPRAARERLVLALDPRANDLAAPILRRVPTPRKPGPWYAAASVSVLSLGALAAVHFGSATAPVQDRRILGGYVVACAILGLALAILARRRTLARAMPFPAGVYVMALDVVDARERDLEVFSLSDLVSIDPVHHQRAGVYTRSTLWLVFPAQTFTFEVRGRAYADDLVGRISASRQRLAMAMQRGRLDELWSVDPLAEARARGFAAVDEDGIQARHPPAWTRFVWAIAIVSGLVLGVAAWRGRNALSDRRAFAALQRAPSEATADAYLRGGGLHAAEVRATLIPRLRLVEARTQPTAIRRIEAIEAVMKGSPTPPPDAPAALNEALHAYYVEQTTVSGLRAFITRWPTAADVGAARAKIHDLYRQTTVEFRRHPNVADKAVVPVVDALFAWAEERAAPVEVRFRRKNAGALAPIDKLLTSSLLDDDGPAKNGNAEVARHFSPPALGDREATIVRGLEQGLRSVFPADVVPLKVGPPVEGVRSAAPSKLHPDVPAPVLIVDYDVGWNGMTYVSRDRQRRFLGVVTKLEVVLQVPKESRVISFTLVVNPPESFPLDEASITTNDDAHVYDVMLLRAFEQIRPQLASVFFAPP